MAITRRDALVGTLAAACAGGRASARERAGGYRVAVVGAGWFGKLDSQALMQTAPVASLAYADVDREMLVGAAEQAVQLKEAVTPLTEIPKTYTDYHEMLRREKPDIVLVDTPDHWHALPTIAALEAGAHVYVQKPVSVDIAEGVAMLTAAATRPEQVVQVALQRRTSPHLIAAKRDVIDKGLLGTIGHVEVFGYFHQRPSDLGEVTAPPSTLDWDSYCGPAPLIPYRPRLHPINWRAFQAFGNGYTGDIGVHYLDAVRWLLGLGWPKSISSHGGIFVDPASPATVPDVQVATFEFSSALVTWTNRVWGRAPEPRIPWGAYIHGSEGTLRISNDLFEFTARGGETLSGSAFSDLDQYPHERNLQHWEHMMQATNRHHMRNFIDAIETGSAPAASLADGHVSTACCILANIADDLGRTLTINESTGDITGDAEAQARLQRPYRAPWVHPAGA